MWPGEREMIRRGGRSKVTVRPASSVTVTGKPGTVVGAALAAAVGVFAGSVGDAGGGVGAVVGAGVGARLGAAAGDDEGEIGVGDAVTVGDEHPESSAIRSTTAQTGRRKDGRTKHLLG